MSVFWLHAKTVALLDAPHAWTRRQNRAACGDLKGQSNHLTGDVVNTPGRRISALDDITKSSRLNMGPIANEHSEKIGIGSEDGLFPLFDIIYWLFCKNVQRHGTSRISPCGDVTLPPPSFL